MDTSLDHGQLDQALRYTAARDLVSDGLVDSGPVQAPANYWSSGHTLGVPKVTLSWAGAGLWVGWGCPTQAALPTILPGLGTVSSQRCLAEQRPETEGSGLGGPTSGLPLASSGLRAWVGGLLMPAWPPNLGPPGRSRGQFSGWSPSLGSTWSSEGSY